MNRPSGEARREAPAGEEPLAGEDCRGTREGEHDPELEAREPQRGKADAMNRMPQIHHFSQANPKGESQGDVAGLLRRVATTIEDLGVVTVQAITYENEVTEEGLWPSVTVYFHYGELAETCACGRCMEGST
jgi:hypothetical protein